MLSLCCILIGQRHFTFNIRAASRQNQHGVFATSMDPVHPAQSDQDPCCSLSVCNRVGKQTSWMLIRLRGCAGWSGSMLVANPLCWFCHGTAQLLFHFFCDLGMRLFFLISLRIGFFFCRHYKDLTWLPVQTGIFSFSITVQGSNKALPSFHRTFTRELDILFCYNSRCLILFLACHMFIIRNYEH
jgi:hypothetical protein